MQQKTKRLTRWTLGIFGLLILAALTLLGWSYEYISGFVTVVAILIETGLVIFSIETILKLTNVNENGQT